MQMSCVFAFFQMWVELAKNSIQAFDLTCPDGIVGQPGSSNHLAACFVA